jgi:hypothetical protein
MEEGRMAIRMTGKITIINVDRDFVLITLDNDPSVGPLDNVFVLNRTTHVNYNAVYSLALAAAANRWPVTIRIAGGGEINSATTAEIHLLGVGWTAGGFASD